MLRGHSKIDETNMNDSIIENMGADRMIAEKQNVHCLLRPFYTFGLLDRTANAEAEELTISQYIVAPN